MVKIMMLSFFLNFEVFTLEPNQFKQNRSNMVFQTFAGSISKMCKIVLMLNRVIGDFEV